MNKYLSVFCILFGYGIFGGHSLAKAQSTSSHLDFTYASGLSLGYTQYQFLDDEGRKWFPVKPMFAYIAGIQYGPIVDIYGAKVLMSFEIGFGNIKTNTVKITPWRVSGLVSDIAFADFAIQRIPAMLWMTITTETKFTPYVRFGMGISKTSFKEIYSYNSDANLRFRKWAFTWGIGGGIQYKMSNEVDLGLFLDDWITINELKEKLPNYLTPKGIDASFKMTVIGMKIVIHFMAY